MTAARPDVNRHRLESGSDFKQDVSSEDFAVDPKSPDKEAGEGDVWGVAREGVNGSGPGISDDRLSRGRYRGRQPCSCFFHCNCIFKILKAITFFNQTA
jgi:hypothetical protein